MTVTVDGDVIRLAGACPVEDAEPLTAALQLRRRAVDLSACEQLHAAVAQALIAFAPQLRGVPVSGFPRDLVAPALGRVTGQSLANATKPGQLS